MVDLARAYSEVKSLPDEALQRELAQPSGMLPGYIALAEMHERKSLRAGRGPSATHQKSMAEEYMGSAHAAFSGAGMGQPRPPEPPQPQMPPQMHGVGSLPPQQGMPQGYAKGGIVSLGNGVDVDPRLLELVKLAAAAKQNYGVRVTSGFRPGDPRFHGKGEHGMALDFELSDPETGRVYENYQDPSTFTQYQDFVNEIRRQQMAQHPELASQLRSGLYFSGGKGKYGAFDPMHIDLGGGQVGMAGGSWETGMYPEQAKLWGIDPSLIQGAGGTNVMMGSAGADSLANYQRALLDTIAGTESPGYNIIYGGKTFNDYSRHPGIAVPITSGPNVGKTSSAAGRYQFITPTWNDIANRYKLADFSPANQDIGALRLAEENYARLTGRSLNEALQSGDPAQIAGVGKALSGTWTSLPGGIESAGGTDRFVSAYQKALAGAGTTPAAAGAAVGQAADAAGKAAGGDSSMGDMMMAMQMLGGGKGGQGQPAPPPAAIPQPTVPLQLLTEYETPGGNRRRPTVYG